MPDRRIQCVLLGWLKRLSESCIWWKWRMHQIITIAVRLWYNIPGIPYKESLILWYILPTIRHNPPFCTASRCCYSWLLLLLLLFLLLMTCDCQKSLITVSLPYILSSSLSLANFLIISHIVHLVTFHCWSFNQKYSKYWMYTKFYSKYRRSN